MERQKQTQHVVSSTESLKNFLSFYPSRSDDTESISASPSSHSDHHGSTPEKETSTHADPRKCHQIAIKILVTNVASGFIIGRSGKTISELQTRSNTRIKLSQSGEYYPGTCVASRVCLIQGTLADAKVAVELIFLKLYELRSESVLSESFSVRLLVPSSFCGMLIGRSGSNIKQLKEESGVTLIQLSQKVRNDVVFHPDGMSIPSSTSERIMTIAGPNFQSCVLCVQLVLTDMASNPDLSRYVNMTTRYSKVMCPGQAAHWRHEAADNNHIIAAFAAPSCLGLQLHHAGHYNPSTYSIGCFDPFMHGLCIETSRTHQSHIPLETHTLSLPAPALQGSQGAAPPDGLIPSGLISPVDELNDFIQGQTLELFSRQPSPQDPSHDVTCEIGIPENMVGSILGRGGNILNELQSQSKTKIRLSQRGEFFPGTDQRIVTITGPSSDSLASAQYLIRERMSASRPRSK
eukprot:CCRYP_009187-RA/>CCRYP_009187-RA protein AED:0.03 eAED:0.03 QI:517/1/0.66/1/0/0.33/3/1704/462